MDWISARRIDLALAVTFVIVLCLGWIAFYNTTLVYATETDIQRLYPGRKAIDQLQTSLAEAEGHQRSYLLLGDPIDLKRYESEVEEVEKWSRELASLAATDVVAPAQVEPLLAVVRRRVSALTEALALRRDIPGDEGARQALELVQTNRGRDLMAQAIEALDDLRDDEDAKLARSQESIRRLQTMRATVLVGHALATGLLTLAGVAMQRDRRKREQAEREKRHSEARLIATLRERDKLLDQVQDAVYLLDCNGEIVYWNEAARDLYGYEAAEAVGSCPDALARFRGEATEADIHLAIEREEAWTGERRARTRAGIEVLVEQRRTLIRDANDQPTGQLVIDIDVTERRRREAQERRGQRLESIGTLTGGIAHDLNNLLTPIIMGTRLLQRDPDGANRAGLLETIHTSAGRGADMIKQLLAFTGGGEGSRDRVEIRSLLSEVRGILNHSLPKTIELEIESPEGLWDVVGDATELSQVLLNLSINARDAMPDGGRLVIAAENVIVGSASTRPASMPTSGPHILISVMDTGSGIPPDVIDRIFDPFFTTKGQGKGTGLGLSTSLGIVRGHGGSLNVYSEVGQGTHFSLYLPAEKSSATAGALRRLATLPRGNGEKILLVDDERMLLEITRATLESYGFCPLLASSGDEAVNLLIAHRGEVSVAIVDMMMPGMDGETTIAELQKLDDSLPTIASSGLRRPASRGDMIAGASGFLPKPYSDEQLLEAISKVMGSACLDC